MVKKNRGFTFIALHENQRIITKLMRALLCPFPSQMKPFQTLLPFLFVQKTSLTLLLPSTPKSLLRTLTIFTLAMLAFKAQYFPYVTSACTVHTTLTLPTQCFIRVSVNKDCLIYLKALNSWDFNGEAECLQ